MKIQPSCQAWGLEALELKLRLLFSIFSFLADLSPFATEIPSHVLSLHAIICSCVQLVYANVSQLALAPFFHNISPLNTSHMTLLIYQ